MGLLHLGLRSDESKMLVGYLYQGLPIWKGQLLSDQPEVMVELQTFYIADLLLHHGVEKANPNFRACHDVCVLCPFGSTARYHCC